MRTLAAIVSLYVLAGASQTVPPPPNPEPIEVVELRLPPISPSNATGACTLEFNPRGTGCIERQRRASGFASGDFTPDGNHIVANVVFVGAPAAPDPASIYSGHQVVLLKVDGTNFGNGDPWKCLSCAVPQANAQFLEPQTDYPHVFRSGDKVLWGHNILDCGGHQVTDDECTPNVTHIYPIHWNTNVDGSGKGGVPREIRLHPDDRHMGWNSFSNNGGQFAYLGTLEFNSNPTVGLPLAPRYDLVNVTLLYDPTRDQQLTAVGNELHYQQVVAIGELRGFSGAGDEVLYVGQTEEANNIDLYAIHLVTGVVRRLTNHPEYADPIAFSPDNQWFVIMDTRGTDRQIGVGDPQQWFEAFFLPWLVDRHGDRGDYFGQQINAGEGFDPNWNGRADPAFSLDGTKIAYWETLVVVPECGSVNPLPCPVSTSPGQAEYRVMVARLTGRTPKPPAPGFDVPSTIPWATPFPPGTQAPRLVGIGPGRYELQGKASGVAEVELIGDASGLSTVAVEYSNFSNDGAHFLSGYENVTREVLLPNYWNVRVDWFSDLVQSGAVNATKKTSPDGFHLQIDVMVNVLNANGTLTTTIDGVEYTQPANGT